MGKEWVEKGPGVGQVVKKCGRLALLFPQKLWDFPQNFLTNYSIHSYPWFWKFGKKILKKGSPNLGITTLFRSREPVDIIILSQENRGHPLSQNLGGLAQGII
jgi:hypothetical protein